MTTFADDHVQLQFDHGSVRQPCSALGISWPPPERLHVLRITFKRDSYSAITDEQRQDMTHVMRGARYVVDEANKERE